MCWERTLNLFPDVSESAHRRETVIDVGENRRGRVPQPKGSVEAARCSVDIKLCVSSCSCFGMPHGAFDAAWTGQKDSWMALSCSDV